MLLISLLCVISHRLCIKYSQEFLTLILISVHTSAPTAVEYMLSCVADRELIQEMNWVVKKNSA